MDDDAAYMLLVTSDAQSELTVLERGLHARTAWRKARRSKSRRTPRASDGQITATLCRMKCKQRALQMPCVT